MYTKEYPIWSEKRKNVENVEIIDLPKIQELMKQNPPWIQK